MDDKQTVWAAKSLMAMYHQNVSDSIKNEGKDLYHKRNQRGPATGRRVLLHCHGYGSNWVTVGRQYKDEYELHFTTGGKTKRKCSTIEKLCETSGAAVATLPLNYSQLNMGCDLPDWQPMTQAEAAAVAARYAPGADPSGELDTDALACLTAAPEQYYSKYVGRGRYRGWYRSLNTVPDAVVDLNLEKPVDIPRKPRRARRKM